MRFTKTLLSLAVLSLCLISFTSGHASAATCSSGASCIEAAQSDSDAKKLFDLLGQAVTFLTAGVGIVVTAMIIVGGIQYTTANGDPNKVTAAKSKVYNALFALVAFIFLWAFLQWLVPGGVFD